MIVAEILLEESSVDIPTLQSRIVSGEQDENNKTTKSASKITLALLNALLILDLLIFIASITNCNKMMTYFFSKSLCANETLEKYEWSFIKAAY